MNINTLAVLIVFGGLLSWSLPLWAWMVWQDRREARAEAKERHPSSQFRLRRRDPERLGYGDRLTFGPQWKRIAEAEGLNELVRDGISETENDR